MRDTACGRSHGRGATKNNTNQQNDTESQREGEKLGLLAEQKR